MCNAASFTVFLSPPFLKNHLCWVFVAVFRLSAVVAHRLSCPMACGIFVPQAGIKPASPSNGRWILNHSHSSSSSILEYACGERKKIFFFHFTCLCLLQNKQFGAISRHWMLGGSESPPDTLPSPACLSSQGWEWVRPSKLFQNLIRFA